jgi:2-keto-4-pentenoate hydratase
MGPESTPDVTADAAEGVARGMRTLLERRAEDIAGGASAIGWKIGMNGLAIQEHFGLDGPVVGYMTDASMLVGGPDAPISLSGWQGPALEVEVAIRVGPDAALAPALELVDLNLPFDDIEPILAANVFHRGVIFGPDLTGLDVTDLRVAVTSAGVQVAEGRLTESPEVTIAAVRTFLERHGAHLAAGDRIIAGSMIAPLSISPGDELMVDFGPLGALEVRFSPT